MVIFSNRKGFTIVELLIVIVIIAILAAITIVAYNGIQERAEASKTIAQASAYIKGLKLYEASIDNRITTNTCIAPRASVTDNAGTLTCPGANNWTTNAPYDEPFMDQLNEYAGVRNPQLSKYNNSSSPAGLMWFHNNYFGANRSVLYYTVGPNSNCGLPNVLSGPNNALTNSGAAYSARTSSVTICMIEVRKW